jgi:flavodoxin
MLSCTKLNRSEGNHMKFKMRILHFSPAGNAEALANAISRAQQAKCDKIPPAYPIEKEKLAFIGLELKGGKVDKSVIALVKDLSTDRVKNVAFYAVGSSFEGIGELKRLVTEKGINVAGSTFECSVKGGLFKKASVTDADVKAAVEWADKIVDSLIES